MSGEYTLEQQQLILEALISSPELFARCQNIIKATYFSKSYEKTARFILQFSIDYKSIPSPEQVKAHSKIDLKKIEDISQEHHQYFLDEIEAFCRHAALTEAIIKGSELLEKGEYGNIEQLVKDALLVGLDTNLGTEYYKDPRARLMTLKDGNGKISTGWKTLDQLLYGVNRGELIIFCAPSGGGKSVALQNLALNMSGQALNCIYVTLELSEELCSMRLDCMVSGIKSVDIFKKIDDVELSVKMSAKQSGKIDFKRMPGGTCTRDIAAYIKEYQIQRGCKPDIILVDYLDLLAPNDKRISPSDLFVKDKYISEELRSLASETNAVVITASQLGRSAVDASEFNHAHIAGGISKINSADAVIGIFNTPSARSRGEIEFQLLKTRNSGGVDKKLTMAYDIDILRITDLDLGGSTSSRPTSIADRINRKPTVKADTHDDEAPPISAATPTDPIKRANNLSALLNKVKRD